MNGRKKMYPLVICLIAIFFLALPTIGTAAHYVQCCHPRVITIPTCCGQPVGTPCGNNGDTVATHPAFPGYKFCLKNASIISIPPSGQTPGTQNEIVDSMGIIHDCLDSYSMVYATEDVPLAVNCGMAGPDTLNLDVVGAGTDIIISYVSSEYLPEGVPEGDFLIRLPGEGEGDTVLVLGPVQVIYINRLVPMANDWSLIAIIALLLLIGSTVLLIRKYKMAN